MLWTVHQVFLDFHHRRLFYQMTDNVSKMTRHWYTGMTAWQLQDWCWLIWSVLGHKSMTYGLTWLSAPRNISLPTSNSPIIECTPTFRYWLIPFFCAWGVHIHVLRWLPVMSGVSLWMCLQTVHHCMEVPWSPAKAFSHLSLCMLCTHILRTLTLSGLELAFAHKWCDLPAL